MVNILEIFDELIIAAIVGLILMVIGLLAKHFRWFWIKKKIVLYLTKQQLTYVYSYDAALKKIETLSTARSIGKKPTELKIMCFMGKDLTVERGLLREIKTFLANGGQLKLLIINPESKYVEKRARELNKDIYTLKTNIKNTIYTIKDEYKRFYPTSVSIRLYDQSPIFRMNFVGNKLFLGFYTNIKSYENNFYEFPESSALYIALRKMFDERWEATNDEAN